LSNQVCLRQKLMHIKEFRKRLMRRRLARLGAAMHHSSFLETGLARAMTIST